MDLQIKTTVSYPPFRKAPTTLEEDIYEIWDDTGLPPNTILIRINWTTLVNNWHSNNRTIESLEKVIAYFAGLDATKTYILISQHDDLIPLLILDKLPPNIIMFNAGGNVRNRNIIPIPLTYTQQSEYVYKPPTKSEWDGLRLASFFGSETNKIRTNLEMYFFNHSDMDIKLKPWTATIDPLDMMEYMNSIVKSRFVLAPSGYGPTSFRFYEAFLNNRIPVYIFDEKGPFLPYGDFIDWAKCCIIISSNELQKLPQILTTITYEKYCEMLEYYQQFHNDFFTISGITHYIKNITTTLVELEAWKPKTVACIANKMALADLIIMLKTLEIYNLTPPTIYLLADSFVADNVDKLNYSGIINIRIDLDKYEGFNRWQMEKMPAVMQCEGVDYPSTLWTELQLKKLDVIRWALDECTSNGVFFSDADICYMATLPNIRNPKFKLLVSPHYIKKEVEDKFGIYNGGFLWTNDKNMLDIWYRETMTSTYFEQKALEPVVEHYKKTDSVLFGDVNINYGWWRLLDGRKSPAEQDKDWVQRIPGFLNSGMFINGKPLQSVHTHLLEMNHMTGTFNKWLLSKLSNFPFYPNIQLLNILKHLVIGANSSSSQQ